MSRLGLSQSCEGAPGVNTSTPHSPPCDGYEGELRSSYYKCLDLKKKLKQQKEDFLGRFCGIRAIIIYNFNCKLMAFLCQPE